MMHYTQHMQHQFHAHQHRVPFLPSGTVQHHANSQGSYGLNCQPYQSQPLLVATTPAVPPPPSRTVDKSFIPPPPPPRSQSFGK
jgi:hypothetical protein